MSACTPGPGGEIGEPPGTHDGDVRTRRIVLPGEDVNAILDFRKTQHMVPWDSGEYEVGDRLWVQERYALAVVPPLEGTRHTMYWVSEYVDGVRYYPASQMPRNRSRITLTLTKVRTLKLGDLGTDEAFRQGVTVPSSCSKAWECSRGSWPGLGAWSDGLSSAGGRPWKECRCVLPRLQTYGEGRGLTWEEGQFVWLLDFEADIVR
jgi:hypothetical protein